MTGNFAVLVALTVLTSETTGDISQFSKITLNDYNGYSSIYIVRFRLEKLTSEATWSFVTTKNHKQCKDKAVLVYFQHSGYPVINITNQTFPALFVTKRKQAYQIKNFNTAAQKTDFTLKAPVPGDWFMATYMPRTDEVIRQQGLRLDCSYYLGVSVNTTVLSSQIRDLSLNTSTSVKLDPQQEAIFRVLVTEITWRASVILDLCVPADACNVTMTTLSAAVPTDTVNSGHVTCSAASCELHVVSPVVAAWLYVVVTNRGRSAVVTGVRVAVTECTTSPTNHTDCSMTSPLDALRSISSLHTRFGRVIGHEVVNAEVVVARGEDVVVPLYLLTNIDIGGTLKFIVQVTNETKPECEDVVRACLQYSAIYRPNTTASCTASLTTNASLPQHLYIPYPQSGHWFVTLTLSCHDTQSCCDEVVVSLSVLSDSCVEGQCYNKGECKYRATSSLVFYTTCHCIAGWQGYACTDDTRVKSMEYQLLHILLLTLSNLFFIPAIIVSVYRKFYGEAAVFFSNMLFSSLYHACDISNSYAMCVTSVDILSYSDFFCSVMSLWVTIVALNEHNDPWHSLLMLTGVMGLQFGIMYNRHSLWVFLVPAVIGITIAMTTWVWKCKKTRKCYPPSRRYWLTFVPGAACALVGVCIFSFIETESNYMYTHSAWHVLMATCIPLVLPKRPAWKGTSRMSRFCPPPRLSACSFCVFHLCCHGNDDTRDSLVYDEEDDCVCGCFSCFQRPNEVTGNLEQDLPRNVANQIWTDNCTF